MYFSTSKINVNFYFVRKLWNLKMTRCNCMDLCNRGWDGYKKERTHPCWSPDLNKRIYSLYDRYIMVYVQFNMRYYIDGNDGTIILIYVTIKVGASVISIGITMAVGCANELWNTYGYRYGIGGLFRNTLFFTWTSALRPEWQRMSTVCIPCMSVHIPCNIPDTDPYWGCRDRFGEII